MRIALINASPRKAKSASGILLGELEGLLPTDNVVKTFSICEPFISEDDIAELHGFDTWVFAFPLYIDAIPSHLLSAIRQIETSKPADKSISIYAVINLGFFEGKQAQNALAIMENWCVRSKLKWSGGIGFGGGGALLRMKNIPLGSGPKKTLAQAFFALSEAIMSNAALENTYATIDLPRSLYKTETERTWRLLINANGGREEDLDRRL